MQHNPRKQVPISSSNTRQARAAHARAKQELPTYDTSAIRPKRSKAPIIIALAVIAVAIAVIGMLMVRGCSYEPDMLPVTQEAVVEIPEGETAKGIAQILKKERLIDNPQKFIDLVNSKDAAAALIPGTYLFKGGMTQDQILDALMVGPQSTADTLIIPEGYTRQNIADEIEKTTNGRITADQFMKETDDASRFAKNYRFLDSAGENSLEGFLFPKTYSITATDDAKSIAKMMLDQFATEVEPLDKSYPESLGLSIYDIVKLASIIQKEGIVENYGRVASVFYNRLNSDRPYLESDATTAYEVGREPTGEEVHADTPYSTYAHEGLPPTPICNPSLAAIQSVCTPDNTDYMYFYSYPDGTYVFSVTYEEHQRTYS